MLVDENWILVITKSDQAGIKGSYMPFPRRGEDRAMNISDYYPFAVYHYPSFDHGPYCLRYDALGLETISCLNFLIFP